MNGRFVDQLFGMSAQWPTSWQGQTHLDSGVDGHLLTMISTDSQPNASHQTSFRAIADRWPTIWPGFRRSITELMERYRQGPPDWGSVRTVYLQLSDEPPAEDAEWSIGVVFSSADTMWVLPFRGWVALPENAQAIW